MGVDCGGRGPRWAGDRRGALLPQGDRMTTTDHDDQRRDVERLRTSNLRLRHRHDQTAARLANQRELNVALVGSLQALIRERNALLQENVALSRMARAGRGEAIE